MISHYQNLFWYQRLLICSTAVQHVCIAWTWDFWIISAAVACSNDVAVTCYIVVFQLYSGISAGKFVEPGQFTACCVGYFASGLDLVSNFFTWAIFLWVVQAVRPCFKKDSVWFHSKQWNSVWLSALQSQKKSTWRRLQSLNTLFLNVPFHLPSHQRTIIIQGKHK